MRGMGAWNIWDESTGCEEGVALKIATSETGSEPRHPRYLSTQRPSGSDMREHATPARFHVILNHAQSCSQLAAFTPLRTLGTPS